MAKFSGAFDLKEPPPWQNCCYCSASSPSPVAPAPPVSLSSSSSSHIPTTTAAAASLRQQNQQQQPHQLLAFKTPADFVRHLRQSHCTVEGGSYVCHYGYNGVCASLPLDGVSDRDYEMHVARCHVNQQQKESQIKWSVFSAAQNLPAVLNDPSRSKQTNFFTKKWGDSFVEQQSIGPVPQLPEIKWDHFDSYMKRIGKRYRVHTRISKTALPSSSSSTSQQNSHHQQPPVSDRLPNGGIANLKDIPEVFLKHNLQLHSPAAFAAVFPGISNDGEQAKQSSRLLQEKLSHYLDIVEVLIAKQVAEKSSAFFHAMTSQDAIMEQMREAAMHVSRLRTRLKQLDDTIVRESLQIISLERIRSNNNIVLERLKLMSTVHQTQPMIQLLLSTQDYVAALDLIGTTQEILSQELVGVHCFRHLPSQLNEMERLIDKMLTTDFERYSTADLNRPFVGDAVEKVLDEDKLICIISGLLRKRNLDFIDTYKEEVITTVRAIVKQMVIEVIASGDAEVCLTGAGEEAQSLSLSEWIVLLETATVTLLKLLKRVRAVHDVMTQTADASAGKITDDVSFMDTEAFLSAEDYDVVLAKLANLLQSVCNYCHERCANLVSNQSLERSSVSADQIAKLTDIVDRFSNGCEKVCGIQSAPLKVALRVQGTRYAQKFHAERKSKLALLLDSERWKQAEVPAEFQKMVKSISKGNFLWSKSAAATTNGGDVAITAPPPQAVLLVDGQPFALVGAALLLVQIVSEYCQCASQLPVIAPQLARNLIDLLRTFNSRSCQLVLGAGALHVAGLKTITSGNLALVSRALQLVLWLLPHIKRHFQSLEPNGATTSGSTSTILSGYDSIEKDFASHVKEIENKVLAIVCDLVTGQIANWDARPPVPSQSFRNISRQYVKLHEAIASILPDKQVATIYRIVHKNFKDKLREQLLRNNITNNGGPQHGTVVSELTFYMETMRSLQAMPKDELRDETLDDIWLK